MNSGMLRSLLFLLGILVSSCSSLGIEEITLRQTVEDAQVQRELLSEKLKNVGEPVRKPSVAIYSFTDKTGQKRQTSSGGTSFSSAVTQAPDTYLIRALTRAGNGKFFKVVDRTQLESLTRERQLIRQTRSSYEGEGAKKLPALTF